MATANILSQATFDWKAHRREQERKASIFAGDYATEKTASALVKTLLDREGWDYECEVRTPSGKAIDYVVTAEHDGYEFKVGAIYCRDEQSGRAHRRLSDHYPPPTAGAPGCKPRA